MAATFSKAQLIFALWVFASGALFFWFASEIIWAAAYEWLLLTALVLVVFAVGWLFFVLSRNSAAGSPRGTELPMTHPSNALWLLVTGGLLFAAWVMLHNLAIQALIAAATSLMLFLLSTRRGARSASDAFTFSLGRIGHATLPLFFTAIGALLAMGVYLSPQTIATLSSPPPKEWYNKGVDFAAPLFERLAGVSPEITVDEALLRLMTQTGGLSPEELGLPRGTDLNDPRIQEALARVKEEQSKQVERQLEAVRAQYAKQFGIVLTKDTTLREFGYLILTKQGEFVRQSASGFTRMLVAVLLLFSWGFLMIPVRILVTLFGQVIFWILSASRLAKIEIVSAERETVVFE